MDKNLMIEIKANTEQAKKEIEELKKEIKDFSKQVKSGNIDLEKSEKTLASFTKRLTDMAHAYVGFSAIKGAVSVVADFEQSIAKLGAISGASKDNLEKLKQKAEELGKSTMFSASEVAEGMNYLAMAGYKTKDILASIGDVLNLAAVGQVSLAEASDIASNILSGFNLKAEETNRVIDVMTATITNANTNIPELGDAMKYVAPQAAALGVSLEETATALGVLSNSGIKATMAGTGLATFLARLASPTGAAAKAINELGIKIYDANGKFVGLTNVLKQFKEKLKGLSDEAKARYIRDIFGLEDMKSAITLINSVGDSFDKLYEKIAKSTGLTKEKVKQMTDTFYGHLKELESAFQGLIITIGNELLPALTDFVKWLTTATSNVEKFYKEHKELINILTKLTATFFALKKAYEVYKLIFGAEAVLKIIEATKAIKSFKDMIILLGNAISKTNIFIAGLTAAFVAANEIMDVFFDKWEEKINKMNESTKKLQDSEKTFKDIMNELQKSMEIKDGIKTFKLTREEIEKLKKETIKLLEVDKQRIEAIKKASDGSMEYKNMLYVLEERQKILNNLLQKLNKMKPYKFAKGSAEEYQHSLNTLTKEQQKYLIKLQDRLDKEKQTSKTILELKNEEIAKAKQVLGKTEAFEIAKDRIIKFYALKEIDTFKKTYDKRIQEHQSTIERLKNQEENLSRKILEINKQLQERLSSLENQRIIAIDEIENQISNLQASNLSKYEQYIDKKKRAEEAFYKAKEELEKGNFELARHYMSKYKSLISSIANTEIKENGRVIVSKKQANEVAINGLKKLEGLTNEYYAKQKQKAIELHNQKLRQLKAQLQAIKAQLNLEIQRLNLEKQLIELTTGKKVTIDTSSALNSIKALDKEIKALDREIEKSKKVKVDADISQAKQKIDKETGKKRVINLYADGKKAENEIKKIDNKARNTKPVIHISTNSDEIYRKLQQIPRRIVTEHIIVEKVVKKRASGGIIPIKRASGGNIDWDKFKRVNGRIAGYDPFDKDDVPALLTRGEFVIKREAVKHYGDSLLWALNEKRIPKELLPRFYTGGMVEAKSPAKLITQISSNLSNENYSSFENPLDELIQKLQDLIDSFNGANPQIVNEIKEEIKKLKSEKQNYESVKKDYKDFKNSNKGKTLNKEEFEKYNKTLKRKEEKLNQEKEIINKLKNEVTKIVEKVKEYLAEVERIKSEIEARFEDLGIEIPAVLRNKIENSFDLTRLKNFNEQLKGLSLETYINKIKSKLQNEKVYLEMFLKDVSKDEYYGLASSYDVQTWSKDREKLNEIKKLLNNEEALKQKAIEELKKNLPKFQTGGIIALQKGGKLAGYGGGDRNLALLEDGEFVIRKEAVRLFGANLFEKLNNLELPKFQTGGLVGNLSDFGKNDVKDLVNINFSMPSGRSYSLQASEEIARALASEFKRLM